MNSASPLRVVLVDDDALLLRSLKAGLERRLSSVTCSTYSDPVVALGKLLRDPPDLLITDQMMPRLGGVQIAKRLRAEGDRCPRLFLMSGSPVRRHDLVYFDAYFEKPIEIRELSSAIERLCRDCIPPMTARDVG